MSYSLSSTPLLSILSGHEEVARLFSAEADLAACVTFEVALAAVQAEYSLIPSETAKAIAEAFAEYRPKPAKLAAAMARDGVAIPALVEELRKRLPPAHAKHVHRGATSQDVVDTSLMLRAAMAMATIEKYVHDASRQIDTLQKKFGKQKLMGHTRMQRALEIKVADKLKVWQAGLSDVQAAFKALRFPMQYGGPVGTYDDQKLLRGLARVLGLHYQLHSWQTQRAPIIALGNTCTLLTGACGKIGQDVAMMAQNELSEIKLRGGGTSSAMAHKQNPVKAEVLVALARFNATQNSALHHSMVHEQERSGAAWTLEWLVLPQMIVAAASAARSTKELLSSITNMGA